LSSLDFDLIQSVIEHMNEDHSAAVLVYVQAQAGRPKAESALLTALDNLGMQISYQEAGKTAQVRVLFGKPLSNAGEIRQELVRMAREGRRLLAM